MTKQIMIVTGEASGDLHGANLVRALRDSADTDLQFSGMGGPELRSLGVRLLFDAERVSVVGIFEVFRHLGDIILAQKILRTELEKHPPDLLILVDLPDFNLLLAKKARRLGIPVFYYIAPQVWAWRSKRVRTIKERVDSLGVILPFEEDFFASRGLFAQYVGHPLLDSVKPAMSRKQFRKLQGINNTSTCVGLLPGSRKREISTLLPVFLEAAEILQSNSRTRLTFLIPKASTLSMTDFEQAGLGRYQQNLDIRLTEEDRYSLMAACDCAVAASGTVTLELAILQVPMVVAYKLSPLSYRVGRLLVKLDHFSLVNLIAGYGAVPELLQDEVTANRVAKELSLLLYAYCVRRTMREDLRFVKDRLGRPGASARAAGMVLKSLNLRTKDE
jgi:lipid-A-disaccharide synthase